MKYLFNLKTENVTNIIITIVSISTTFLFANKYIISFWILILSLKMLIKARNNSYLIILFGIISYVNISVVVSEIIGLATALTINTLSWQNNIRSSDKWLLGAKSLIIMLSVLNNFFDTDFFTLTKKKEFKIELKDNSIIFYTGYVIVLIIWLFFGYASSIGSNYSSDTSTLYEYCLIIVPILWLYSGDQIRKKVLIAIFILLYSGKSMLHGDRSSMLPMIIFSYFIFFTNVKLSIRSIIILAIFGIIISNIISVYRTLGTLEVSSITSNLITQYGPSFLTSDTVSQSYYTSVVVQLSYYQVENKIIYFIDFIIGIIFGGSYGKADVSKIVSTLYTNKYGGFYYSWFYFWFGNFGVFWGSIVLGYILRIIYIKNSSYLNILKVIVIIFSIRWYVYTPFVFFRSVLFVYSVLYFLCWVFNLISKYSLKNRKML